MKMRPHFVTHPGLIVVPPAGPTHVWGRVFAVLRRAFAADAQFYLITGRTPLDAPAWPAPGSVAAGADKAAIVLTQQLRLIARRYIVSLPAGLVISSHS